MYLYLGLYMRAWSLEKSGLATDVRDKEEALATFSIETANASESSSSAWALSDAFSAMLSVNSGTVQGKYRVTRGPVQTTVS